MEVVACSCSGSSCRASPALTARATSASPSAPSGGGGASPRCSAAARSTAATCDGSTARAVDIQAEAPAREQTSAPEARWVEGGASSTATSKSSGLDGLASAT